MKEFDTILEKIFSDTKYTRSEKEALGKVIKAKDFDHQELSLLRSRLFDTVREKFDRKEERDILTCLEDIIKTLMPSPKLNNNNNVEAFFSPGDACRDAIKTQIRQARSSLDICVFTISDDRITQEIGHAWDRGIKVRIISDNDKQYDRGSDIKRLKSMGIPVATDFTDNHMHHKFAVIDKCTVLAGSYNWTRSAAVYNNEDIIILDDRQTVDGFMHEFERLWAEFS